MKDKTLKIKLLNKNEKQQSDNLNNNIVIYIFHNIEYFYNLFLYRLLQNYIIKYKL